MKVLTKTTQQAVSTTDVLAIFAFEGMPPCIPEGVEILPAPFTSFTGSLLETRFTDPIDGPASRILLLGLGKPEQATPDTLRRAAAIAVQKAEKTDATALTFYLSATPPVPVCDDSSLVQALAEGVAMAAYRLEDFKRKPQAASLKKVTCHGDGRTFKQAWQRGITIGNANGFARRLQDTPGNLMRPRDMAKAARGLATGRPQITCKVIDEAAMKKLGMGSLLSVSRGSSEPAYLIHLCYKPARTATKKVCLVGKGLTFDAGGISIKPSAKMDEMKYDMSGGAAVLGVFHALAHGIAPSVEIHGLVPTSENLPDGKANKPGDVVTAMNGLSIEVLNTDAEGRLILADALAYAVKNIKPHAMIDLATLTGAVVVALGHEYTGIMGNDQDLLDELLDAGESTAERTWQLPLDEVHRRQMHGTVGDLKNINAEGAGSSAGGAFLSYFVGDTPWAHCDIAGSAWGTEARNYQGGSKGTGVGVRLLLEYLNATSRPATAPGV